LPALNLRGATLAMPNLSIVSRPVGALKPDPLNPRLHKDRQIRLLMKSVSAFGFNVPVLVDADQKILAGHGRVLAAQKLGMLEVPTISIEHLTDAQARAFAIADNRLTEISVFDENMLAEQLKALSILDLDFSLEATGFEMGEIDLRIEGASLKDEAAGETESPPPAGPPISKPGDLWLLGRHRLCCGSALESVVFKKLMNGEQAAMIFADAPYNVPIDGHVSGLGAVHHREFAMASGEMDPPGFTHFLTRSFELFANNSIDGSVHFICMDWRHCTEVLSAGREVYTTLKNICVWVKHNAGMGSLYRSQHELVFVFKSGRAPHRNNIELGRHGRHRSNVWEYAGASAFGRSGEEGSLSALHPTVKPVRLVADAILDCSARGDIILDGYVGSGTTIIAAERTGRRCYAIEIDPLYVDTAVRRWQAYTGEIARHAQTGEPFEPQTAENNGG
jgi:DNA modification methylase